MFKNWKLKKKLLFSFFVITCVTAVATTTFAIYFFSEKIKAEAHHSMRRNLRIADAMYNDKISKIKNITNFLANDSSLQGLVYFVIQEKLNDYLTEVRSREELQYIAVVGSKRQLMGEAKIEGCTLYSEEVPLNELVEQVLETGKEIVATEQFQATQGTLIAIAAASPIFKKTLKKELVAVILVRYVLNNNAELVDEIQRLIGVTTAIYHDSKPISWKKQAFLVEPRIDEAIYTKLMQRVSYHSTENLKHDEQLAEYRTIYDFQGRAVAVIGVSVSAEKYVQTIYQAIVRFIAIMLLCILFAFFLAYLLARSVVVPIHNLLQGIDHITSGDLSYTLAINTTDELGTLAVAFNSMANRLNGFFQIFKNTIETLTHIGTALSSEKNLHKLLEMFVSEACHVTHADTGILYTLENNYLHCKLVYSKPSPDSEHLIFKEQQGQPLFLHDAALQSSIYMQAILNKEIINIPDIHKDTKFDFTLVKEHDQLAAHQTKTLLVVPLLDRRGETVGVLKLANPIDPVTQHITVFSANQVEIVNSLASQAAVAIENARTHEKIEAKNKAFERFVPIQFLSHLGKTEVEEINLGDACHADMSVLFADIRSFTGLSETMTPSENFNFLNDYLRFIGPCITDNGGFIDKFIGDAIMALFSGSCVSVADDALSAAMGMLKQLEIFNHYRCQLGQPTVTVGMGIHSGPLMLGMIGFKSHMESTVIGDTVNLASRIESLTKYYGITIGMSSRIFNQLRHRETLLVREIDTVQVKGKKEAVTLYDVFNFDPEALRDRKLQTLEKYCQALSNYQHRQWEDALCLFHELHDSLPTDKVINIYLQRCHAFKINPPGEEWCGIMRLDEK